MKACEGAISIGVGAGGRAEGGDASTLYNLCRLSSSCLTTSSLDAWMLRLNHQSRGSQRPSTGVHIACGAWQQLV